MTTVASTVQELQAAVRQCPDGSQLLPVAGATKPGLSLAPTAAVTPLDVTALTGIVDYDPGELTLTALAGTSVTELADALAEHGQYLPFDPLWADAGATLGGVVAAGTSGSNALRYGGVRDFVLRVQMIDGTGRLVSGGAKVVKNAAGFDLPKLMVGSMGRLGVMIELSLKVFPRPPANTTLVVETRDTGTALSTVSRLLRGPLSFDALDLDADGRLLIRLGGDPATLEVSAQRAAADLHADVRRCEGDEDAALWRQAGEMMWAHAADCIVQVPIVHTRVPALDAILREAGARARYGLAGNIAWVAWAGQQPLARLDEVLTELDLAGTVLVGPAGRPLLGAARGGSFAARVRGAIDPHRRFPEA